MEGKEEDLVLVTKVENREDYFFEDTESHLSDLHRERVVHSDEDVLFQLPPTQQWMGQCAQWFLRLQKECIFSLLTNGGKKWIPLSLHKSVSTFNVHRNIEENSYSQKNREKGRSSIANEWQCDTCQRKE